MSQYNDGYYFAFSCIIHNGLNDRKEVIEYLENSNFGKEYDSGVLRAIMDYKKLEEEFKNE